MTRLRELLTTVSSVRVAFLGISLVVFGFLTGHHLYHVNTIKLLILAVFTCLLWVYSVFFPPGEARQKSLWLFGLILLLPTLGTLPGGWFNPEDSVYFPIELVTDMLCIAWALVVARLLNSSRDCRGLILWMVMMLLIVALRVAREALGFHPINGNFVLLYRPNGSFGNVNYLAGFLAVLTPPMVLLALPEHSDRWRWDWVQRACTLGVLLLIFTLALTQTRAAMAAALTATIFSLLLAGLVSPTRQLRRLSFGLVGIGGLLVVLVVGLPLVAPGLLDHYPNRLADLYNIGAWWGRTVPLRGALNSIQASPFIGWGPGSSYNLNFSFLPTDADLYIPNSSYNHLHNEWLEIAQEGGLFGVLLWLTAMLTLATLLIRYAKHHTEHFPRFMALGIVGAMAAFYAHGIFSVAQRMIVANLPLYTLFGLGLVLLTEEHNGRVWSCPRLARLAKQPWYKYIAWLRTWQVALAWMCIMWLVFLPWLISFSGMVRLNDRNASLEERVEFFAKWPNPYGLSNLLNHQMGNSKFNDALLTANTLDTIIPHYRQLPARKSEILLNLGRPDEALQQAMQQRQLSHYQPANNVILAGLVARKGDAAALFESLRLLFIHGLIYTAHRDAFSYPEQIDIGIRGEQLDIRQLGDKLEVDIPQSFIDGWIDQANNPQQLSNWLQQQMFALSQSGFFQPPGAKSPELMVAGVNRLSSLDGELEQELNKQRRIYFTLIRSRPRSAMRVKLDIDRLRTGLQSAHGSKRQEQIDLITQGLEGSDLSATDYIDHIRMLRNISGKMGQMVQVIRALGTRS